MNYYIIMPYKIEYINVIISRLSAVSEGSFQDMATNVLSFYYRQKELRFEKVEPARGDFKNDGWVPEKSIYFQIYSPINFSASFVHDVYSKFENDFEKLAYNVFRKGKWSGYINEFYFLLNTRDRDIPRDDDRIVEKTKEKVESTYGCVIKTVEIVNKDFIKNILFELNEEQLKNLVDFLGFSGDFDILDVTPRSFAEFIGVVCNVLLSRSINQSNSSFSKIPDEEKIAINDLRDKEERITTITAHLGVIEEAVDVFTASGNNASKLQNIINYCVEVYLDLKQTLHGGELYDAIIDRLVSVLPNGTSHRNNVEFLIVYIFDRCDIFERSVNAITE